MSNPYDQAAARAFLMGGKVRSAFKKGDPIGLEIEGTITEPPRLSQQMDYDTNEPEVWADGNPKMQLVVTIQTDLNEPTEEFPEDDGLRRLYVKGDLQKKIQKAVNDVKADNLEPGGKIRVKFTGLGPAGVSKSGKPLNPPRIHAAKYTPPAAAFLQSTPQEDDPWGAPPPPQRQPVTQQQTPPIASQPDDPFAGMGLTPQQLAAVRAATQSPNDEPPF